jgi:hypothetical protein
MKPLFVACLLGLALPMPSAVAQEVVPASIANFPNSPEGAYKALIYAMGSGDEAAIRVLTVKTPGLGRLLETSRIPVDKRPAFFDRLLTANAIKRLEPGDTVRMSAGEIYTVKAADTAEGRAMIKDGPSGTLPIRCRLENGRWKVDARLIIANRHVAGVMNPDKGHATPRRSIAMPGPLTGPAYPNTPEGACRTFLVAYLTADAPNLHAVALPEDGFEWLLKREPCSFDQAAKYQADLDKRTFRTLKVGDTIDVGGRKLTITAKDVTPTRALIAADYPGVLPTPCEQIDGKWWVDPRPLIIGLKAEAKSKAKTAPAPASKP